MDIKYSQNAQRILIYAKEEAMRTGHITVGADHILLALLRYRDNDVCAALQKQFATMKVDGLTGKGMTWDANGMISKAPAAMVVTGGAYTPMA